MERDALRSFVFEILRENPQTHLHAIENEIRRMTDEYERHDALALHEVVWELLVQGVLAPGKNSLNLNLPFVHVTDYGARCLDSGEIIAHDPDGYISRLVETSGRPIDSIVVDSVREGLLSYSAGRHSAAIVLLARAAERLFALLVEAVRERSVRRDREPIDPADHGPAARYAAIRRALAERDLSEWARGEVEPMLSGLRALVQLSRTDEGDPRSVTGDRDRTLGYFLLFPDQCRLIYHLIDQIERAPTG